MIECTRRIEFDAAHRVIGHKNKCKYLHGHRYVLEITARSSNLNEMGMVIDFGDLKSIIKKWVDDNWDHNAILHKDDRAMGEAISAQTGQKIYYIENNPTAENIALHFKKDIITNLFDKSSFEFVKIRLYETPNCFVDCL